MLRLLDSSLFQVVGKARSRRVWILAFFLVALSLSTAACVPGSLEPPTPTTAPPLSLIPTPTAVNEIAHAVPTRTLSAVPNSVFVVSPVPMPTEYPAPASGPRTARTLRPTGQASAQTIPTSTPNRARVATGNFTPRTLTPSRPTVLPSGPPPQFGPSSTPTPNVPPTSTPVPSASPTATQAPALTRTLTRPATPIPTRTVQPAQPPSAPTGYPAGSTPPTPPPYNPYPSSNQR